MHMWGELVIKSGRFFLEKMGRIDENVGRLNLGPFESGRFFMDSKYDKA